MIPVSSLCCWHSHLQQGTQAREAWALGPIVTRASTSCVGGTSARPATVPEAPHPAGASAASCLHLLLQPPQLPPNPGAPVVPPQSPPGCHFSLPWLQGKQSFRKVGAGGGRPRKLPTAGFRFWGGPQAGHRVAGLGGTDACARSCPCWVLAQCRVFLTPWCPSPFPDTPFPTSFVPLLEARPFPAPWEPSPAPVSPCAGVPAHMSLVSSSAQQDVWPALGPTCGLLRPCPDQSCKFRGGQGSPEIPFPRTGGSLLA